VHLFNCHYKICAIIYVKLLQIVFTLEAAKILSSSGACKIILACRNTDSGENAAVKIREHTSNTSIVECRKLDLASLQSVQAFAQEIKERDEKIYALICNAGVWIPNDGINNENKTTKDGYESHFGVNHLGHFALIQSLIPQMEQSETSSRIVIVSSSLCKSGKIDIQKPDFIHKQRVSEKKSFAPTGYCDSKLMNMLTCRELAKRLPSNILSIAVSPGFCASQLGRNVHVPIYKKMLMIPIMRLFQRSTQQGALNIVFATTEDEDNIESGSMYQDGIVWKDGVALMEELGEDLQKELWKLSEELINKSSSKSSKTTSAD